MLEEYITNIYIVPLIATSIGLILVYLYDKYEKKQYTSAQYLRIGLLLYSSTYSALYISKLSFFTSSDTTKSGGSTQSVMPQPNNIQNQFEQFRSGVPTF
jgi:hypothetical protein